MSDTPRTDAKAITFESGFPGLNCSSICDADFARELERELNTARDLHANAVHLLNQETLKVAALRERALPAEMTPAIREVLGMMIYSTGPIARGFRAAGKPIAPKAEDEQAFVLFWLLGHALKHGDDWRKHAAPELPVWPSQVETT